MNFFVATLGEVVIVQVCVLAIWLRVLFGVTKVTNIDIEYKRLVLTSLGLVLNAAAIGGIILSRAYQFTTGNWPFVAGLSVLYGILSASGFLFIVAASLNGKLGILKMFFVLTFTWTAFCLIDFFFGFGVLNYVSG